MLVVSIVAFLIALVLAAEPPVFCAGGSLGTMIPPSVVAVVYASLAQVPVGELFAAMLFPGLLMTTLFVAYILIATTLKPELGPRANDEDMRRPLGEKISITMRGLVPMMLLIIAVLGSLMKGIASPTEAAALGAAAAAVLAVPVGLGMAPMSGTNTKLTSLFPPEYAKQGAERRAKVLTVVAVGGGVRRVVGVVLQLVVAPALGVGAVQPPGAARGALPRSLSSADRERLLVGGRQFPPRPHATT